MPIDIAAVERTIDFLIAQPAQNSRGAAINGITRAFYPQLELGTILRVALDQIERGEYDNCGNLLSLGPPHPSKQAAHRGMIGEIISILMEKQAAPAIRLANELATSYRFFVIAEQVGF